MEYGTGIRAVRALVDGPAHFVEAVGRSSDFDPVAFAAFARAQNFHEWLTPLLDDERARALLCDAHVATLEERRAALPGEKRELLALSLDIQKRYEALGIPCLFVKGLVYGALYYGDVCRRHQFDLDALVPPAKFEPAVHALVELGFDDTTTANAKPVERRLEKMRTRDARRAPHTITLARPDGVEVDLHNRLKSRLFRGMDASWGWADRRRVRVLGHEFETLSEDATLAHLLVSICADVRRAACRGKPFLDLLLALRALGDAFDWEAFFERRAAEQTEKATVNALAIFLCVWREAREFPLLTEALERRLRQVELRGAGEAGALLTRPRRSRWNRLWFVRLRTGTSPLGYRALRATLDLPRILHQRLRREAPWSGSRTADTAATPAPSPAPELPRPLRELLDAQGLRSTSAEEVSGLLPAASRRRCYRIQLHDGSVVKGRVVKTRQVVRRMLRWNPELPPGRFSRLIAARGVATLETWLDGTPCDPADPALATRAGELLGRVHTAIGVDLLGVSHPERIAQREKIATWTEELFAGGRLTRQRADAVAAALRDAEPEHARWGLQHGDFCIENLLEVDGELRCIDNPTVRASLLDLDLAQAFYRWPLSAAERERFLAGYRRLADPSRFEDHEAYWTIVVAVRAAAFRLREGTRDVELPLRLLARHVS